MLLNIKYRTFVLLKGKQMGIVYDAYKVVKLIQTNRLQLQLNTLYIYPTTNISVYEN